MNTTSVAVLLIGNEILEAQVIERNYIPIARSVQQKGIFVGEVRIVRDLEAAIITAVQELSKRYAYVICAGGIGPTHDDITLESVAKAFDQPIEQNEAMTKFLLKRNSDMNDAREKMAHLPVGSTLLQENDDMWPVISFQNLFILPGLPPVLTAMMPCVVAQLPMMGQIHYGYVVINQSEQDFAQFLDDLQKQNPSVLIGSYPSFETKTVKISLTCIDEEPAERCYANILEYFGGSILEKHAIGLLVLDHSKQ